MNFYTDIHGVHRMNCYHFGDPLTFLVAPSSVQIFDLSHTLVYDQIKAKLIFLSASAVLSAAEADWQMSAC